MSKFDSDLLTTPRNLKDFIHQYNHKKEIFDMNERHDKSTVTDLPTNKNCFSNCDTHEIWAKPGNFIGLSYIGQSDLHITYYGLPHVWYTPGRQWV